MPLHFEWDPRKAAANAAKHGVTFEEASTVFGDPKSLTIPDPAHSAVEQRFIVLGRSHAGRLLVVPHCAGRQSPGHQCPVGEPEGTQIL